jgi:hypothetical protein
MEHVEVCSADLIPTVEGKLRYEIRYTIFTNATISFSSSEVHFELLQVAANT